MYYKNHYNYEETPCKHLPEDYPDPDIENLSAKRDYIIPFSPYSKVYNEPSFDYVMIKTTTTMMNDRGGSLYESTKRFWRAGKRISGYAFVISVVDQIVQRVYIADTWFKFSDGEWKGRWGFFGREAKGKEFEELIGKRIPEDYRKVGTANPVQYKR